MLIMEGVNTMHPVPVYSKDFEIDVSHVDFTGRLKLSSLFQFFQDAATLHADTLGIGMREIHKTYNALWVLVRMRVDIERYPAWGDRITVETWPEKPHKFEFMRNFLARDNTGHILAKAVSTWVVIDIDTRKLKMVEPLYSTYPLSNRERPIDCKLGRFQPKGSLEAVYKRPIGYSDIDINEHLNNSKYIDFIMDCFSLEYHKNFIIESIEINYKNEAFAGDTITLFKDKASLNSDLVYIEGINEDNEQLIFKSQLKVRPR